MKKKKINIHFFNQWFMGVLADETYFTSFLIKSIIYDEILTFIQAVVLLNWPPFHGMSKLNIYVARMFLSKNEIIKLAKTN